MPEKPWLNHYPTGVTAGLKYPPVPAQQLLMDAAHNYPSHICLRLNNLKMTYAQVEALTTTIAGQLVHLGIKPGERVGLFLPNLPEFVLGFFAILKAGAVVASFSPQYKPEEFIWLALDASVNLVISDKAGYAMLRKVRKAAGVGRLCVVGEGISPDAGDLLFSDLCIKNKMRLPNVGVDAPAIYQYSGGTTGIPKGAIATHRNLVANSLQFRNWLWNCKQGEEVLLAALPLYHVYGMVLAMCLGMALGATIELVPNPRDKRALLASIRRSRPTISTLPW